MFTKKDCDFIFCNVRNNVTTETVTIKETVAITRNKSTFLKFKVAMTFLLILGRMGLQLYLCTEVFIYYKVQS